jgi:putative integral membrane protein (TIGR02587 family)
VSEREQHPWRRELNNFSRAFSGAFLFGIPLLFTMEMWWIGTYADLWKLTALLVIALVSNVGLNYFAGFKLDRSLPQVFDQAIDAMAVGVVASTVVLFVLNRVALTDPIDSIVGKIIVQAVPLSLGASLANAVFQPGEDRGGGEASPEHHPWRALANDLGATAIGGIFLGVSIAPTDEVPMLAGGLTYYHELLVVALSLVIGYAIVFISGFDTSSLSSQPDGLFQKPITETTVAYLVSLLVAFLSLYLFDRVDINTPVHSMLSQTIVLALPTTVGGAAGRLAV